MRKKTIRIKNEMKNADYVDNPLYNATVTNRLFDSLIVSRLIFGILKALIRNVSKS